MADVVVSIATYKRQESLDRLLELLDAQSLRPSSVIVVDNDREQSARSVCEKWPFVHYFAEPRPGVAWVRSAGLRAAISLAPDYVAFVDDDEIVPVDWLNILVSALESSEFDAAGGPVVPRYPRSSRHWTRRWDAHAHGVERSGPTDQLLSTNNSVVRTTTLSALEVVDFDATFGLSGGEDADFFYRLRKAGARFRWQNEARVEEEISPSRLSTRWFIRRGVQIGYTHARLEMRYEGVRPIGLVLEGCGRSALGGLLLIRAITFRRSPVPGLYRVARGFGYAWAATGGGLRRYGDNHK